MRKIIICLLMVIVMFSLVACDALGVVVTPDTSAESGQLGVLRTDSKLTQDQLMSQIKAEYLIENNGYRADDDVVVMVTLKDEALIDTYNRRYSNEISSVGEYAKTAEGVEQVQKIAEKQDRLLSALKADGLIEDVEYTYTTVINAVAITVKYGNLDRLDDYTLVDDVILSETYNLPQSTESTEKTVVENDVDVYPTGIFDSSNVSYSGIHTAVAILDSGFDCSHSVFANQPEGELLITRNKVSDMLSNTQEVSNAVKGTPGLKVSDVYYSDKIPFAYDYADSDPDVFPYDSEHGTHVAGIIGGKDDTIKGVATNTQLVLMKVFPDLDEGAPSEAILAALEDAVLLQVDAINMSLGSSCGFASEVDEYKINEVYEKIGQSGISLITAASNSYSSAFGGEQGNTNLVTNPDSGTVGSPSTYASALSVASISGTKSKYIVASEGNTAFHTFYFLESNSISGEENDFFGELGLSQGETRTFEYVTVPGVGLSVNYAAIDVRDKIALVKRGDNTFEEKAQIAKSKGAIGCIIYNNVEGSISMSMGKSDHIPTISISKDDGTVLASKKSGTLTISYSQQAGPFMSDFSSWGPMPSLELKPEITAHGGNILSSVPGGGYDTQSGTSMASPNLCGIVVLIRQYLKEKFTEKSMQEITALTNQLMMSTANIVLNEDGNPYSPRKQGAGLASLINAVTSKAYITVDGTDRTKLELYDDPERTGVYTMKFNVVNFSDQEVNYDLSVIGMTESVSTSNDKYVAEKSQLLNGTWTATVDGVAQNSVTVKPNSQVAVELVYTLTDDDMLMIDRLFPYGMYVEGFVKLTAADSADVNLNVPFLAFYGDWTEAPMFDKTYYEVESEAHNEAIDDEDKIKADYYATTPYGSYLYNYIIPLGTYLYDIDLSKYDAIPATEDHIAISNVFGTIDGISSVYAGLLRNAKEMVFTITDKVTGEVVYELTDYNAVKAYSLGGSPIPYFNYLKISSLQEGFINNRQYEFKMQGKLDYGDGGTDTNVRNSFSFDFYMDNEAPVLKDVSYEKVYDKTLKKDRYYITLTVYDNHYAQSITPLLFNSSSSYTVLSANPIPIYGERNSETAVRFEITDYLEDIYEDKLITSALAFSIDDYALNSAIYICQLPGTKGDFKFTSDGSMSGTSMSILNVTEGEVVDLTEYLATGDSTVDADKDYLKYLNWASSNTSVVEVKEGLIKCLKPGIATVTVTEQMDLKAANIIINVKAKAQTVARMSVSDDADSTTVKNLRFSYFDTLFAYSRAAQTSEIGSTGSRIFLSSLASGISFYPGEKVKLYYDLDPWYAEDNYDFSYSSTNETVAVVNQEGEVTALKEGSATITLKITNKHTGVTSNIMASVRLTVKSEFVIEDRVLVAYKGLGGEVVIPDDEGILYIGSYAFCLYETDYEVELPEDDYDANKIPSANTSVTSVVIPYGVEDIQKYAFYNCSNLKEVQLPSTVKYIREYAFYNDKKLTTINLEDTKTGTIGAKAFYKCESLEQIDLTKVFAIGANAFEGCISLTSVDLTALRNSGAEIFKDCSVLSDVTLGENTKLSSAMFARTAVVSVDIYEKVNIPEFLFAQCKNLESVTLHNSLVSVGKGAFSECTALTRFNLDEGVEIGTLGEQMFYGDTALDTVTLPDNTLTVGAYAFLDCTSLQTVVFGPDTYIEKIDGTVFQNTSVTTFDVTNSKYYSADQQNGLLLNKEGDTVIFVATGKDYSSAELVLDYENIAPAAFSGINVVTVTFTKAVNVGDYAFANCKDLATVNFADAEGSVVGKHSFRYATSLVAVNNLDKVTAAGDYAFANTGLKEVTTGDDSQYGEGAFFSSKLQQATLGANSNYGLGAFQDCVYLETVNMPAAGGVHFGRGCFARDVSLKTIDLSKTDDTIEAETFYGCTSLATANLTNVKHIGDYAFADCSALRILTMPVVERIGEGAFGRYSENGGAPQFSAVQLPATLTQIGDGAFLGCSGLTEITLPEGLTAVPNYTFAYCNNLKTVVLPDSVTTVGEYAFAGCSSLTSVNLANVETYKDYAFTSASSLANVDLSGAVNIGFGAFASTSVTGNINAPSLEVAGDYAFQQANIVSFDAPVLKSIGIACFHGNSNMKEFVLSDKLEYLGVQAFLDCSSLTDFFYNGADGKTNDGKLNDFITLYDGILYTVMPSGDLQLTSVPANKNINKLTVQEGTARVDLFAGNQNKNITSIVLPDTMKSIGNYAFYGYDNLDSVEFRSFTAPTLENSYNDDASLSEGDPGYDLLHGYFEIMGWELCYFNFVNLLGKEEPINMILPANEGIEGYDSLVFRVYFGNIEDAVRSNYVARDKNLVQFFEYAKEIAQIKTIAMTDDTLITNAVSAYNAITQDPTDYGYSKEQYDEYVTMVLEAKETLRKLKLSNASLAAQQLQTEIDALPQEFDIKDLAMLQDIANRISKLTASERMLLDLTNYTKLQNGLTEYNQAVQEEIGAIKTVVDNTYLAVAAGAAVVAVLGALAIRRRFM